MTERNKNDIEGYGDNISFLSTIVSYGLVIRASVDDIQSLKQLIIKNYPDVRIVYQRISADKLKIIVED